MIKSYYTHFSFNKHQPFINITSLKLINGEKKTTLLALDREKFNRITFTLTFIPFSALFAEYIIKD